MVPTVVTDFITKIEKVNLNKLKLTFSHLKLIMSQSLFELFQIKFLIVNKLFHIHT